jgi:hypothetical protein
MKKVILTVALVLTSLVATSQTFDNPRILNSIADAKNMEWASKKSNPGTMMMYGKAEEMRQYLFDLRQYFGLNDKEMVNGVASWYFFDRNGRALQMVASESSTGLLIVVKKGK